MFLINLPASCGLAAHNMRANLSEFGPGNVRGGFQTRPYEPREDFRRGDPWVALHPPQSSAAVPDFVRARSGLHSACRASGRGGFQTPPLQKRFCLGTGRNSVTGDRCGDAGGFPLSARRRCNGRRQAEKAGVTPRIARSCSSAPRCGGRPQPAILMLHSTARIWRMAEQCR